MMFQANPFPDIEIEAQAIILMGTIAFSVLILAILMILMIYFYVKVKKLLPILVIFLFSLVIGMYSMTVIGLPFTPFFQLFFLLFQTILFYMSIEGEYRF